MYKMIFIFGILLVLCGCMNSPIALRSNLYFNPQNATTEGQITTNPPGGTWSVEAPKTTSDSYRAKANISDETVDEDTTIPTGTSGEDE